MSLLDMYISKVNTPSDINEHLTTLKKYTDQCKIVVECGVRAVTSSYAFAISLKGRENVKLYQVDPSKSNEVTEFQQLCENELVPTEFFHQSDLDCPLIDTDLLFIDTWHIYGQLKRELSRWNKVVSKYIIMHDTTIDEWKGETIRVGWNAEQQSKDSGIPVEEINKGLWPAIEEFLVEHPEWKLKERFTNNNGLTILQRLL
jgi:hypothetical protein